MRQATINLSILLISFLGFNSASPNFDPVLKTSSQCDSSFKLSYVLIGFGSNMFSMEPVFRVNGTKFIYTSEEVWTIPNFEKQKPDTLLTGDFRTSSIDSIAALVNPIQDTLIYKSNPHIMSGGEANIEVCTETKKVTFQLFNASDTTAKKIVTILNSYILSNYKKLWISSHNGYE